MRYSIAYVAPLVAAVYAQGSTSPTDSAALASSSSSIPSFSNFETQFLTQTNSLGVVTGQPTPATLTGSTALVTNQPDAVTSEPGVVTTQPEVATIPAGLPTGINTVPIGNGSSLSSFFVSVGTSTTVVVGGPVPTDASVVTSGSTGGSTATGTSPSGSGTGSNAGQSSSQSSAAPSTGAAPTALKFASGAVLGLGAMAVALL